MLFSRPDHVAIFVSTNPHFPSLPQNFDPTHSGTLMRSFFVMISIWCDESTESETRIFLLSLSTSFARRRASLVKLRYRFFALFGLRNLQFEFDELFTRSVYHTGIPRPFDLRIFSFLLRSPNHSNSWSVYFSDFPWSFGLSGNWLYVLVEWKPRAIILIYFHSCKSYHASRMTIPLVW